jgi:hypothetical protein
MKPVLSSSLINCHAVGMDSIVFKESAPMIRAFVCRPEHTLWRNEVLSSCSSEHRIMSVAIHQHRQDITMVPVCGDVYNVFTGYGSDDAVLHAYAYDSHILDGKGGFRRYQDKAYCTTLSMERLDNPKFLRGQDFHTVYVPRGQTAAWLICEGAHNMSYTSLCWTNDTDLEHADFSELYKPMTERLLNEDLHIMNGGQVDGRS